MIDNPLTIDFPSEQAMLEALAAGIVTTDQFLAAGLVTKEPDPVLCDEPATSDDLRLAALAQARRAARAASTDPPRGKTPKRRAARTLAQVGETPTPDSGWLTIRQAAARLGIGERTLRAHIQSGAIKFVDVGRGRERSAARFTPEDIEAFKAQRGRKWRSADEARSTTTSSSFEAVDFAALLAKRHSAKPAPSSAPSVRKRGKRTTVVNLKDVRR
jgi:excisionase family DNA binding protein